MIHKYTLPLAPFGISIATSWEVVDGAYVYPPVSRLSFEARQIVTLPNGTQRNVSAGGATLDISTTALTDVEKGQLYQLLAKCFECDESMRQLGADEYVPPVIEEPVA